MIYERSSDLLCSLSRLGDVRGRLAEERLRVVDVILQLAIDEASQPGLAEVVQHLDRFRIDVVHVTGRCDVVDDELH